MTRARFVEGNGLGKKKIITESSIELRTPDSHEVLGVAEKMLGFDRIMVKCMDGHTRMSRIRGKMKRRVWIRVNDIVIVSPWDFQTDQRGDITYQDKPNQVDWLKNSGRLDRNLPA